MSRRRDSVGDASLLAWGEALRRQKMRRDRLYRRVSLTTAGTAIILATIVVRPAPRLLWNASASAPIGLYAVMPGAMVEPGDTVIARVPEPFRRFAAERHYLPSNVPLVKRVAAYAGDDVCARGATIAVNGRVVARRRAVDGHRRAMPSWTGCIRLRGRQLLLLTDNPASFDGRYFGVTDAADVIGKGRLLWRR